MYDSCNKLSNHHTLRAQKLIIMFLLSLVCIILGGSMAFKLKGKRDLYAPKSYLTSLMSRPKSVYAY